MPVAKASPPVPARRTTAAELERGATQKRGYGAQHEPLITHDAGVAIAMRPIGEDAPGWRSLRRFNARMASSDGQPLPGSAGLDPQPWRERCTTARGGRVLALGEHHRLQRTHRQRAQDDDLQATYRRHRPMAERSIAWLTRDNRRVPYRGIAKNNAWLHTASPR